MLNFKSLISYLLVFAFTVLTACTAQNIEGVAFTASNPNCRASTFEELVQQNASDLGAGTYRNLVEETLSEMAVSVWRSDPSSLGSCQARYKIGSTPGQPVYNIEFQSEVSFFVEPSRVCINHTDANGPDRNGIRVSDADIEHPWKWVDQGPSVDGLPDGYFSRREYVPVCFNKNGGIEGYLNG